MRGRFHSPTWRTFFASLLLLWAFADLSVPGLCKSDNDGANGPQQESMSVRTGQSPRLVASSVTAFSNPGQQQSAPDRNDEDCFCCCVHVAPSTHFRLPELVNVAPELAMYSFHQVTASTPSLYHPPRV